MYLEYLCFFTKQPAFALKLAELPFNRDVES